MKCKCGSSWECVCPTCNEYAPSEHIILRLEIYKDKENLILIADGKRIELNDLFAKTIGFVHILEELPEPPK